MITVFKKILPYVCFSWFRKTAQFKIYVLLCIGAFLNITIASAGENHVVIFADFACTDNAAGDPDDCLAVEALKGIPHVNIVAVMTTGGNTQARRAFELGKTLFPDLVVLPGTRPRSKQILPAHYKLASLIKDLGSEVRVLVLSPATDLEKLNAISPDILKTVKQVVFVAGRAPGDTFAMRPGWRTLRDMNFEKDRRAFAVLLPMLSRHRVETMFVGFRAAINTDVPIEFVPRDYIQKTRKAWARKCRLWFGAETPLFDVVAAMAVTPYRDHLNCQGVWVKIGYDLIGIEMTRSNFRLCR